MTLQKSLGSDLFQIDVRYYGTGAVVTLMGDLDVATAPELREVLQGAALDVADTVELNVEGVTFIDSIGMGILVSAHKRFDANGRTLIVRSPNPRAMKVLEVAGLGTYLNIMA